MKIGYPCINRTLSCQGNKTFRLKSYSKQRFIDVVSNNLSCLQQILKFNRDHNLLFFRISSDIIPFASHPILSVDWVHHFQDILHDIGQFIKNNEMRISMHPDQFIVLNSKRDDVVQRSIDELEYHATLLNAMKLDYTAKTQLHVGGVYGNKKGSMTRFVTNFDLLSCKIKKRLVIENDERSYSAVDCLEINDRIQIPVLLDVFHHQLNNQGEFIKDVIAQTAKTWRPQDGIPMIDYSSQEQQMKPGKHATHIDTHHFMQFLKQIHSCNVDVMLEIKDKEKSAIKALALARKNPHLLTLN